MRQRHSISLTRQPLTAFTDGSCVEGCGGWAVVVLQAQTSRVLFVESGAEPGATDQHAMELLAIAKALELTAPNRILIKTDSKLAYDILALSRLGAMDKPHLAVLVRAIWALMKGREVMFQRVQSGRNRFNRKADKLAYERATEALRYVQSTDLDRLVQDLHMESRHDS